MTTQETEKGMISPPKEAFKIEGSEVETIRNLYLGDILVGSFYTARDGDHISISIHTEQIKKQLKTYNTKVKSIEISVFTEKRQKMKYRNNKNWNFSVSEITIEKDE